MKDLGANETVKGPTELVFHAESGSLQTEQQCSS